MKRYKSLTVVILLSMGVWVPLWMIISGSFMPIDEVSSCFGPVLTGEKGMARWPLLPNYPTLSPWVELLLDSPEFFTMLWNSVKLVVPILLGQVVFGMPAAWALARFKFPGKKVVFLIYIGLMLMPFQVTMVSNYLVLDKLQVLDTRLGIILPAVFSTFPVFIMYRFFKSIPQEMLEAVSIDGAGHFRAFIAIGLPLGAPGVISILVLGFFEYWNMIEQPMIFLQNKSLWPLSLYLPMLTMDNLGVSVVAAVIMLIPAMLIFLWGQSELEAGIGMTGLKE